MNKKVLLTAAILIFAISTSTASAQTDKPYLIMVQAGYTVLTETDAPGGSIGLGGGLSYLLMPDVTIGAEVSYFNFGTEPTNVTGIDSKASAIPVTGQIAYYVPTQSNIIPYGGIGAGIYNLRTSVEGAGVDKSDSGNKFGTNFGGGIKFESDSSFSYGVDVRYHIAFQDEENWNMISVFGKLFF